jgi:hypothetical protein
MIDEELLNTIAEAFRDDGYSGVSRQKRSRSVRFSATEGERRAVVHNADSEPKQQPIAPSRPDRRPRET